MAGAGAAVPPPWPKGLDPNSSLDAWAKLSVKRDVRKVDTPAAGSAQPPGTLRLVCVSDTHGRVERRGGADLAVPAGDVLVHAGDFSNVGEPALVEAFAAWLEAQPHRHKVVIAGNHDLTLDPTSYATTRLTIARGSLPEACPADELKRRLADVPGCSYLEDSGVTIDGVRFWGSPWTPEFYGWGFNANRGKDIAGIWRGIPTDTDVLVTHGPPVGVGDLCADGNRAGCVDLLREVEGRVRPHAHVFGHIHEGYGAWGYDGCAGTTFVNASTCTLRYQPTNPPVVVDVPLPGGHGAP